jgi:hypothetical protein
MSPTHEPRRINELCFGGDWACAHGDLSGLAYIAEELAERVREPLHGKLVELARTCRSDPDRATARWFAMKDLVRGVRSRRV